MSLIYHWFSIQIMHVFGMILPTTLVKTFNTPLPKAKTPLSPQIVWALISS